MVAEVFTIELADCSPATVRRGRRLGASTALGAFVGGPENSLARAAAEMVLSEDASWSPLVFCGPTGTGKSMLALGLAGRWQALHPDATAVITTGADFARDWANACKADSVSDFRRRLRRISLFVVEDAGELEDKPSAQEEFARTLDMLSRRGVPTIATLREPPYASSGISAALASRLTAGLTVPLVAPAAEARRALLQELAAQYELVLEDDALDLLVEQLPLTAAHLSGALQELAKRDGTAATAIKLAAVKDYLSQRETPPPLSLAEVTAVVAQHFGVKVADLRGPSRRKGLARARGLAMLLSRRLTGKSLQQIGHYLGKRDHTTVMHGCRRTEDLLASDDELRVAVSELSGRLGEQRSSALQPAGP